MNRIHHCSSFASAFATIIGCTDLAVSSPGRIQLISIKDGVVERTISQPGLNDGARGLALDATRDVLYFTTSDNDSSILSLTLTAEAANSSTVVNSSLKDELVQSLVFDPVESALYWSDNRALAIFKADSKGSSSRQPIIIHEFQFEIPQGLAIDPCRRLLFWTNINHRRPSIERSSLDGSNRQKIVTKNLFQPLGLTLDPSETGKLYWGNDLEGVNFALERCSLDGSDREELLTGRHHMPFSLALIDTSLYWSDWTHDAVWTLNLSLPKDKREEKRILQFENQTPYGILSFHNDSCQNVLTSIPSTTEVSTTEMRTTLRPTTTTSAPKTSTPTVIFVPQPLPEPSCNQNEQDFCLAGGHVIAPNYCRCPVGFAGSRCEQNLCQNFCLNNGTCVLGVPPTCICPVGYFGLRCERRVCDNYCLNGGSCQVSEGSMARCHCDARFSGPRCEVRRDLCGDNCDCSTGGSLPCLCGHRGNATNNNDTFTSSCFLTGGNTGDGTSFNYIIICLITLCTGLLLAVGALSWQVGKLRRRPRIKRRVVVSRREMPLPAGRGGSTSSDTTHSNADTCEITIENCCNMNICETPCFEPPVRSPGKKGKREEKKTLLSDMEDQN